MTNKLQLMTALTLAIILIASGLSLTPEAFSTGNNGNNDKDKKDDKDKKGSEDSEKFKKWKKENESHDDDDEEHEKIKICHIPEGNPANKHTIEISESALTAHLGHGDTIGACPNDNVDDELAYIIFIRAITDDNNWPFVMEQFKLSIANGPIPTVGQPVDFGVPIPIEPNTDKYITGEMPAGFKSVLITGDPSCPVNINDDKFSLKEGKTIICTIYYDDVFQSGGSEGNDPTVKVTVQVNGLPDVDPTLFTYTIGSTEGVTDGDIVTIPKNVPVEFSQTNHLDELDGKILPTSIQGDGNCPDVINTGGTENGFITLGANQNIECIVVYGEEIKPGVIFHYDTQMVGREGAQLPNVGTPCGEYVPSINNGEPGTRYENTVTQGPCIAINGANMWVVPDSSVTLTDTTIVLFTVIIAGSDEDTQLNPDATTCVFNGLAPTLDEPDDNNPVEPTPLAFRLFCTDLPNTGNWNVNYALIEANPLA